jgi:hypothetical protein
MQNVEPSQRGRKRQSKVQGLPAITSGDGGSKVNRTRRDPRSTSPARRGRSGQASTALGMTPADVRPPSLTLDFRLWTLDYFVL